LTVIGILLIQGLGQNAYDVFNTFLLFATALFDLTVKPLTRSFGKRFEKFEIGLGAIASAIQLLFFNP
jgi:hypothetical protein